MLIILSEDYYGNIEIDHDNRKINMVVKKFAGGNKDETRKVVDRMLLKGQSNNVKSLSGGERSMSTVMFLISLWKTSASPFR